jgi:hypothetical protein
MTVGILEGYLEGTDVFQTLNADVQALVTLFVEFHGLTDAPVEQECQCDDAERENEIGQNFTECTHIC